MELFRKTVREFVQKKVIPTAAEWERERGYPLERKGNCPANVEGCRQGALEGLFRKVRRFGSNPEYRSTQ